MKNNHSRANGHKLDHSSPIGEKAICKSTEKRIPPLSTRTYHQLVAVLFFT